MMGIVFILSSLWMAMASAAPISYEVGCQPGCLEDTNTENAAAVADHSVDDSTISETGPEALTAEITSISGNTQVADTALKSTSGEIVIEVVSGAPGLIPIFESSDGCVVVYAYAEAEDGAVVTDHDSTIVRNNDGAVSGLVESYAEAVSGGGGQAKAVSIAVSSGGGSIGSSAAIARAE